MIGRRQHRTLASSYPPLPHFQHQWFRTGNKTKSIYPKTHSLHIKNQRSRIKFKARKTNTISKMRKSTFYFHNYIQPFIRYLQINKSRKNNMMSIKEGKEGIVIYLTCINICIDLLCRKSPAPVSKQTITYFILLRIAKGIYPWQTTYLLDTPRTNKVQSH